MDDRCARPTRSPLVEESAAPRQFSSITQMAHRARRGPRSAFAVVRDLDPYAKRRVQIGWSRGGAQQLLHVKTAIINGRLDRYTGHRSVPADIAACKGVRWRAQWVWNTNAHSPRIHTVRVLRLISWIQIGQNTYIALPCTNRCRETSSQSIDLRIHSIGKIGNWCRSSNALFVR